MLNTTEKGILKLISEKQMMKKKEVKTRLQKEGFEDIDLSLKRLKDDGYIRLLQPFGDQFIITQKGIRALGRS